MAIYTGKNGHSFARKRPILTKPGTYPVHLEAKRDTHFRPLPAPTGQAPFRLDLADVLSAEDHKAMIPPVVLERDGDTVVTLHSYLDDHHGFLEVTVEGKRITGDYYQVPRPQEPYSKGNQLTDHWEYDWQACQWVVNDLSQA